MNHTEATQYIKATLAAFGPGEAISMMQDTWANLHEAMNVLIEQPASKPWADLMRGVRVEGDTVVISTVAGNATARLLCSELLREKNA